MKFETSWFDKSDLCYYERVNDGQKSLKRRIPGRYEYFEPSSNGDFTTLVGGIKVERRLGKASDTHDKYGVTKPIYLNIRDHFWGNAYNTTPNVWYLDIETRALGSPSPEGLFPITLIQVFDTSKNLMIVLGLRAWQAEPDYDAGVAVKYLCFKTEEELLQGYLKLFKALDPLIIYAWNGSGFDFPYIFNRLKKYGLHRQMSNYGDAELEIKRDEYKLYTPGHHYMDMLDVYKKFVSTPRKSYSLDSIATVEVRANKVEHTEFNNFDSFYTGKDYTIAETPYEDRIRETIRQLMISRQTLSKDSHEYQENEAEILKYVNFQFVYYGIIDVVLLRKIDLKLKFTSIILYIAQMMGVLIDDTIATVKPWAQYISNVGYTQHKVMPKYQDHSTKNVDLTFLSYPLQEKVKQYYNEHSLELHNDIDIEGIADLALREEVLTEASLQGGFVKDPVRGKHLWVMNADVNSMYPMLSMASFNMSPETYVSQNELPQDLRFLINKYFSGQKEGERFNVPAEAMHKITALLKQHNLALSVNGACFTHESEGIIPALVKRIYTERKQDKKTMQRYENRKVLIQSIIREKTRS